MGIGTSIRKILSKSPNARYSGQIPLRKLALSYYAITTYHTTPHFLLITDPILEDPLGKHQWEPTAILVKRDASGTQGRGIWVNDWDRSCDMSYVQTVRDSLERTNLDRVTIVASSISEPAMWAAEDRPITFFLEGELVSFARKYQLTEEKVDQILQYEKVKEAREVGTPLNHLQQYDDVPREVVDELVDNTGDRK